MAEQSLRSRLSNATGSDRNYADALAWGIRWEGLRSSWFSSCGCWADADDALARQSRFEREYRDETGEELYGH